MNIIRQHPTRFLLLLIVVLALVLRLYHLNYQSLWVDEIASMVESDPDLSWWGVIDISKSDQPPAFFLLLHGWLKIFGASDYAGRMFSVFVGIAGVIAMFFLGKQVKDERVGLVAAFITALSYIHILFSQEVRFYTPLYLFTTLSYLFYIRAVRTEKILDFLLYAVFTGIVMYTHYFGLVVFASQGIIFFLLLFYYRLSRRFILLGVSACLLSILIISPWLPVIFTDIQTPAFWIQQEKIYFFIVYFYVYFKDVVACSVFALLILYFFFMLFKQVRRGEKIDSAYFILATWGILSYLIPIIYSLVRMPMLHVRYTIIALPALIVMISIAFFYLKESFRRILLIVTGITIIFSLIVIEKHYTKIQKEDWRGMITTVVASAKPTDVFVSRHPFYCNYYFKYYQTPFKAIQPDQFNASGETPSGVWWLDGFDVAPGESLTEIMLLQKGYRLEKLDTFVRAKSAHYILDEKIR